MLGLAGSAAVALAAPAVATAAVFDSAFGVGVDSGGTGFETCTTASGCQAGTDSIIAGGMSVPSGVAVDAEGRILVADPGNARIDRFTVAPGGSVEFDRAFGEGVNPTLPGGFENCTAASGCQNGASTGAAGSMNFPVDVVVDAQGRILVADRENHRIQRFTVAADGTVAFDRAFGENVDPGGGTGFENCTTASGCQAGTASGAAGGMQQPQGVAVDAQGRILVADSTNSRIQRFTVAADGSVAFDRAFGVDVDPGGGTGFENCTTASGCQAGTASGAAGATAFPSGVAVDAQGRILSVGGNVRVDRFAVAGDGSVAFDRAFGIDVVPGGGSGFENCTTATTCQGGTPSGAAGGMRQPQRLAVDSQGRILVADFASNRIDRFSVAGDGSIHFAVAFGVDVVPGGGTGFENCTTASGCQAGTASGAAGGMSLPNDVAVDAQGRILVADGVNNRVDRFAGPTITVTKALAPAEDPGRFDLLVDGAVARAAAGNGDSGTLQVVDGSDVTIRERAASGENPLSDYDTTIDCGGGPQPAASLTLSDVTVHASCTIANARKSSPPPQPPTPSPPSQPPTPSPPSQPPTPSPPSPPAGLRPDFEIVNTDRNRRKGTATLTVEANTPGAIKIVQSRKIKGTAAKPIEPGDDAKLKVAARKAAARTLERKGRLSVNVKVRFNPESGGRLQKGHDVTLRLKAGGRRARHRAV
jgi:NHL repeat